MVIELRGTPDPFVNGGLFKDKIATPKFCRKSRSTILNSGDQDWSAINLDIFGSMFQAVISVDPSYIPIHLRIFFT